MTGGPWRLAAARLRADRGAMIALGVIGAIYLVAILAPLLAPYDPTRQLDILALKNQPPSHAHPFGTDPYGRDVLSRVIHGSLYAFGIAIPVVIVALLLGVPVGLWTGWSGGWPDEIVMRGSDALRVFPSIILALAVVAAAGPSLLNVVLAVERTRSGGAVNSASASQKIAAGRVLGS